MPKEKKVCGYTINNLRPQFSSLKDKDRAEREKIKNILLTYNKLDHSMAKH